MRPGNSLLKIHTPVPRFKENVYPTLKRLFDGAVSDKIFYRAVSLLVKNDGLSPYEAGLTASKCEVKSNLFDNKYRERMTIGDCTPPLSNVSSVKSLDEVGLLTEYQTIRKLPKTGAMCLAVHNYIDPIRDLERSPQAACVLRNSMNHMGPATMKYRDLEDPDTKAMIFSFLDNIVEEGTLK